MSGPNTSPKCNSTKMKVARASPNGSLRNSFDWLNLVEGVTLMAKPGTKDAEAVLAEGTPNIRKVESARSLTAWGSDSFLLNLSGSFMIYVHPDIEDCSKRIKEDAYWRVDVWDKERTEIWPLLKWCEQETTVNTACADTLWSYS